MMLRLPRAAIASRAMQAPVKMLAPMLLFIFPCTFLILLYPIVMSLDAQGLLK